MKNNPNIIKLVFVLGIIALFAGMRILFTGAPNVSPVAAFALFGATMFRKNWMVFLLPVAVMFASDWFVGFYDIVTMSFVYGSFLLVALIGFSLRRSAKMHNVLFASLASSIVFYILTNFGVWMSGMVGYPMNWSGLVQSYVMAVPFFRNEVVGTLGFSVLFFGVYEYATQRIAALKTA